MVFIAGDIFPDANLNPKNTQEYKENVEKVLKFMQNKSIKMHQTSAKGKYRRKKKIWNLMTNYLKCK